VGRRGKDSLSGTGSDAYKTRIIIKELPAVFSDFGISTMPDIPCGDLRWVKSVNLDHIDRTGADIVNYLTEENVE